MSIKRWHWKEFAVEGEAMRKTFRFGKHIVLNTVWQMTKDQTKQRADRTIRVIEGTEMIGGRWCVVKRQITNDWMQVVTSMVHYVVY